MTTNSSDQTLDAADPLSPATAIRTAIGASGRDARICQRPRVQKIDEVLHDGIAEHPTVGDERHQHCQGLLASARLIEWDDVHMCEVCCT